MKIYRTKILYLICSLLLAASIALLCSCDKINNQPKSNGKYNITDVVGREFSFDEHLTKVIGTHNPILNHIVVLGNGTSKYLAGFGKKDKGANLYSKIMPDWNELPTIGDSNNPVNKETVIKLNPQLALIPENTYHTREKDFDGTGIKTFVAMPKNESFETIKSSLFLISQLFGEEQRAKEVFDKFDSILNEVKSLGASASDKPKVAFMGTSKYSFISSNMIQSLMIEVAGGQNIAATLEQQGLFNNIDAETIAEQNPDYIFIPNYASYKAEDILNDQKLSSVTAVKNKNVYVFPSKLDPWDWQTCSACLGTAWMLSKIHPDLYSKEKIQSTSIDFYKLLYNHTFTAEEFGLD